MGPPLKGGDPNNRAGEAPVKTRCCQLHYVPCTGSARPDALFVRRAARQTPRKRLLRSTARASGRGPDRTGERVGALLPTSLWILPFLRVPPRDPCGSQDLLRGRHTK